MSPCSQPERGPRLAKTRRRKDPIEKCRKTSQPTHSKGLTLTNADDSRTLAPYSIKKRSMSGPLRSSTSRSVASISVLVEKLGIRVADWLQFAADVHLWLGGQVSKFLIWRRKRDSNPRASCPASGFQDRRLRPLGHSSNRILTENSLGFERPRNDPRDWASGLGLAITYGRGG